MITVITVKFKNNKAYPTLLSSLKVMTVVYYKLITKGYIKMAVWYPEESLYLFDKSDQSDVLKMIGFKSIKRVRPEGAPYKISNSEKMIGFRRKKSDDKHIEFGIHQRINGIREPFDPTAIKVYPNELTEIPILNGFKWYYIPSGPYFGGHDSNQDGIGGKAPKDLIFKIKFL